MPFLPQKDSAKGLDEELRFIKPPLLFLPDCFRHVNVAEYFSGILLPKNLPASIDLARVFFVMVVFSFILGGGFFD